MSNSAMVDQKGRLKITRPSFPRARGLVPNSTSPAKVPPQSASYPRQVWNQVEERMEHCAHTMATTRNFLSARSISARLSR